MNMDKEMPKRKPLRIKNYDYNTPDACFITFCTHNRKNTLAKLVGAIHESPEMQLTEEGRIVDPIINSISERIPGAIDRYVIMPNHVHLLIRLYGDCKGAEKSASDENRRSFLSKVVGYIKMNASKEIRKRNRNTEVWRRGYHDHVIRNQQDYDMIYKYIVNNPKQWELDRLYSIE
ncbi:MAG: hypothetical protein E7322_09370 [Clostridiales bacterium]|nr:hypothetical protein [Clostridiales bacterium]